MDRIPELARDWVREWMRRNYSFYNEAAVRELVDRAEGRSLQEAFLAGAAACNSIITKQRD